MEIMDTRMKNLPDYAAGAKQAGFNPYADNGGTIVAIAGKGYCIIASETRLSTGFSIYTRNQEKLFPLSEKTILGSSGCWCDILTFTRLLAARMQMYQHEHLKEMSTKAAAQMISTMLYYKRFFPYYISNVLAGLDENGDGVIFGYDPIGHGERQQCKAGGSSGALLQPLLDNQVDLANQENAEKVPLSKEKALTIIKDVFVSAAERDILTGDRIAIKIITPNGIESDYYDLRKD